MRRSFLQLAACTAAAMVLAGCATGVKHDQMASSIPSLKPGDGRVYFYREASMMGAALQPEIRLNGQVVGASKPGGFFYVDRPAGTYTAAATTEAEKTLSFALQAGETKYVRSHATFGIAVGRIQLELEPADKARAVIGSLSYTGVAAR